MGPQFFQTGMGQKFFEVTVPRIATALERIATALEKQNEPIIEVATSDRSDVDVDVTGRPR